MAGRPRKYDDNALLDAAERVIARGGVGAVTVAAVAREAGAAASSLHARFGGKRELLLAVAARAAPPEPRRDLAPREALLELLDRIAGAMADRDAFGAHFSFFALDVTDDEFRAHARRWMLAFRATIADLLQQAGYADAEPRAQAVHAAQQGALLLWAIDGEGDARARVRAAVEAVL
jgi:AcrR family transcriptional regulator